MGREGMLWLLLALDIDLPLLSFHSYEDIRPRYRWCLYLFAISGLKYIIGIYTSGIKAATCASVFYTFASIAPSIAPTHLSPSLKYYKTTRYCD